MSTNEITVPAGTPELPGTAIIEFWVESPRMPKHDHGFNILISQEQRKRLFVYRTYISYELISYILNAKPYPKIGITIAHILFGFVILGFIVTKNRKVIYKRMGGVRRSYRAS